MPITPPGQLINLIHKEISKLLKTNPAAASSESYILNYLEFKILNTSISPSYLIRIGINYHGQTVQHLQLDSSRVLIGWNPGGDSLGTGSSAKVLLSGYTIFDREPNEPAMNDTKIGGGPISPGSYIRIEFKARGWLGKTKNLAGKELEKDLDLLKNDQADLLVLCLSETAHRKWRGEGPSYQAQRRTGTNRFRQLLVPTNSLTGTNILRRDIIFEGQPWTVSTQKVVASASSIMPGAEHFVTLCWRRP